MGKMSTHEAMPPEAEPVKAAATSEYVEWPNSIEFKLPDGREIVMKPFPLNFKYSTKILKNTDIQSQVLMSLEMMTVSALLNIDTIDGKKIAKPQDELSREALEQQIGARCLSVIVKKNLENFPDDIDADEIQVIKK